MSEPWTPEERARRRESNLAFKCLECVKIMFVGDLPGHLRTVHGSAALDTPPQPKPETAVTRICTWLFVAMLAGLAFGIWRWALG